MNELSNVLAQVPQHISRGQGLRLNNAARQNLLSGFAVISYRGSRWRVKYKGDLTMIEESPGTDRQGRPLPVTPVQELKVVVVGMSPNMTKTYYSDQYEEGNTEAPTCSSMDGVVPDAGVAQRQSPTCAACPQNRFGSAMTKAGKKAKACRDSRRLAVVPAGDIENETFGGPMLLGIPVMSLQNLDRYCRELDRVGADISQVVTGLSFDTSASYPVIQFRAVSWIEDQADFDRAVEWGTGDEVPRLLNYSPERSESAEPGGNGTANALAARPAHVAQAQTQQAPAPVAPAAAPVRSGGGFGTRKPTPVVTKAAAQPAPAPEPEAEPTLEDMGVTAQGQAAPTTVQTVPSDMASAIDRLLQR